MPLVFIFLTLSMLLLWLPPARTGYFAHAWLLAFIMAVGLGLYDGQLDVIALIPFSLFAISVYYFQRLGGMARLPVGMAIVLLSLALGLHLFPGFHNPLIVEHVRLGSDTLPYTLRLNFDKAVIGLFILLGLRPLLAGRRETLLMLQQLVPIALVTFGAVVGLSLLLGYIRFDVKLPGFIGYWLWANLFFTCLAEEALFRGFLQRQLAIRLATFRYGAWFALVACALLFGIAHAAGGIKYIFLATVAGLGYGWAYHRTQRIEASILLHFTLNSLHILLFSYPALTSR